MGVKCDTRLCAGILRTQRGAGGVARAWSPAMYLTILPQTLPLPSQGAQQHLFLNSNGTFQLATVPGSGSSTFGGAQAAAAAASQPGAARLAPSQLLSSAGPGTAQLCNATALGPGGSLFSLHGHGSVLDQAGSFCHTPRTRRHLCSCSTTARPREQPAVLLSAPVALDILGRPQTHAAAAGFDDVFCRWTAQESAITAPCHALLPPFAADAYGAGRGVGRAPLHPGQAVVAR